MQSQPAPSLTYDALGRLVNAVPNASTNDVVREVITEIPLAQPGSMTSSGLMNPTVLNAPHLFVPTVSISNPPVPLLPAVSQAAPGTMIATGRPFLTPSG